MGKFSLMTSKSMRSQYFLLLTFQRSQCAAAQLVTSLFLVAVVICNSDSAYVMDTTQAALKVLGLGQLVCLRACSNYATFI
jgi:hypothetical protein